MEISGAQMLIKAMEDQGVEKIFGYPGGAVLEIYDALEKSTIDHILVRNEQGGAHAASGYARAKGQVGVCLATSGPGATNLVTGIATAYMDSVPLVAITGQVPTAMVGTDAFQEVDITGITSPITKYNYLVQDVQEIPRIIAEAFYIAKSGRPGPVLIDIPRDVAIAQGIYKPYENVDIRSYKPTIEGHPAMIKKAARLIKEAENLVICAGGGVINSNSTPELEQLVKLTNGRVVATLMGLGSLPGNHENYYGMLGTYGNRLANELVQKADCFLALGMRFDDRVVGNPEGFAPNAKIIHIDIDPAEIGKNIRVDIPIVGDIRTVLKAINASLGKGQLRIKENPPRDEEIKELKTLSVPWVLKKIQEFAPEDTIITTDVGQHQMWTAQNYCFTKPRTFISSGGLGTMGYGIPAGVGAQIAKPNATVVVMTGDGSFQMGLPELGTILENDLPLKIVIFNNRSLGMVRQLQHYYCGKRYTAVNFKKAVDFITLAKAYGAEAYRLTEVENVDMVLKEAFGNNKFTIIEIPIETEDLVLPMVLAGDSLEKMVDSE
ncbi:MAG: biosynthetic-type acetolactate synthase large subunit [Clostridia bacterium]|nr:biosynthetic-type acetolactate synthase large subunit [Clostridia bacterium]